MVVGLSFPQWDRFDRNGEYVTSNETNREERKEEEFSANLKTFFAEFGRKYKVGWPSWRKYVASNETNQEKGRE